MDIFRLKTHQIKNIESSKIQSSQEYREVSELLIDPYDENSDEQAVPDIIRNNVHHPATI